MLEDPEDPSREKKVHLHPNTDGKNHQEVRRSCKQFPAAERGGARILQSSICRVLVQDLVIIFPISKISRSTLRSGANSRATALGASSWHTQDHEDLKRMAMNKSFPGTKDFTQAVQRQVKTLIERKDASSKIDQYESACIFGYSTVCWSLESRSIQ